MNQKGRDDHIKRLAEVLNDVLAFVDDAKYLDEIERHAKTITVLIQQVTECGHFITGYAKQKNFCPSPLPLSSDHH